MDVNHICRVTTFLLLPDLGLPWVTWSTFPTPPATATTSVVLGAARDVLEEGDWRGEGDRPWIEEEQENHLACVPQHYMLPDMWGSTPRNVKTTLKTG